MQALLDILQPIFDPGFHPSSYGYRPGRNCHQAITKGTMFIRKYERKWVVDMDLYKTKFPTFDEWYATLNVEQKKRVDEELQRHYFGRRQSSVPG